MNNVVHVELNRLGEQRNAVNSLRIENQKKIYNKVQQRI